MKKTSNILQEKITSITITSSLFLISIFIGIIITLSTKINISIPIKQIKNQSIIISKKHMKQISNIKEKIYLQSDKKQILIQIQKIEVLPNLDISLSITTKLPQKKYRLILKKISLYKLLLN